METCLKGSVLSHSIGNRGIRKTQLADFVHLESLVTAFQVPPTLGFQLDIPSFFL